MAVMLGSELTSLCVARRVGPTSLLTAPTVGFWREQLTVELARWLSVYRSLPQQSLSSCSRKRAWISILQLPLNYSHLKVGHGRSATASPGSCLWVMSVASSAPTGSTSARDSHDSAARLILTSPQDPYSPRAYAGNQGGHGFSALGLHSSWLPAHAVALTGHAVLCPRRGGVLCPSESFMLTVPLT